MSILFQKTITVQDCKDNPDKIYIFGDNYKRIGKRGQAEIRDEPNTYGIVTKHSPTMQVAAYLRNKDLPTYQLYIRNVLLDLERLSETHDIVFPLDGLGTGLARLPNTSPECFSCLSTMLERFTGHKHTRQGFIV